MMGTMGSAAAVCLIGAVLAVVLKKSGAEWALLLSLTAAGAALLLLFQGAEDVLSLLREMVTAAGLAPKLFTPLLKTAVIALIGRVGAALCRDAGESALAAVLETAAAFGAIMASLPLFEMVWDMLRTLL